VNETFQSAVWIAALILAVFAFALAVGGVLYLIRVWKFFSPEQRMRRSSSASTSSLGQVTPRKSGSGSPSQDAYLRRKRQRDEKQFRERQKWTLASLVMLMTYALGIFTYLLYLVAGVKRYEQNLVQDLGLWLAATSIIIGLWTFVNVWFMRLPPLKLYGKLFNIDSILIRKPGIIRVFTFARVFVFSVLNLFLLVLITHAIDNSPELRFNLDTAFLTVLAGQIFDFIVFSLFLSFSLRSLFLQLKILSEDAVKRGITSGVEMEEFQRALDTVDFQIFAILIIGPVAIISCLLGAFLEPVRTRTHLSLNFIILLGNIACLVLVFIVIFRMDISPRNRRKLREKEERERRRRYTGDMIGTPSESGPLPSVSDIELEDPGF